MADSLKSSAELSASILRNYVTGYSDTLAFLFGRKAVCHVYEEYDCTTSLQARQWMSDQALKAANYGVCDGMVVAGQMLWLIKNRGQSFLGKQRSSNLKALLEKMPDINANSLEKSNRTLQQVILEAYASQTTDEIYEEAMVSRRKTPGQLLEEIRSVIANYSPDDDSWKNLPTVGIYRCAEDGRLIGGHTLLPFAVEKLSDTSYRIHVYDVNYPRLTQYLEIDKGADTWRYQPKGTTAYEGSNSTHSLETVSFAKRAIPYIQDGFISCPFCASEESQMQVSFVGVGELLISKKSQHVGFEPDEKKYVNTLLNAKVIEAQSGGLGQTLPRTYIVPGSVDRYEISTIGLPETGLDGYASITKPGFTAQIKSPKNEPFLAKLKYARWYVATAYNPDANILKLQSTGTRPISFTLEDESSDVSYQMRFLGGGGEGQKFFLMEKSSRRLYFGAANYDISNTTFKIEVTRLSKTGDSKTIAIKGFDRKPTEFSYIDLSKLPWDTGAGQALDLDIYVLDLLKETNFKLDHQSLFDLKRSLKLTQQSFDALEKENIPGNILESLKMFKDRLYHGEANFIPSVERKLGKEQTDRYKTLILKHVEYLIPEDIVEKLRPLEKEGKDFVGKDNFLEAVKKMIGEEQTSRYKELIMKHAPAPNYRMEKYWQKIGSDAPHNYEARPHRGCDDREGCY